MLDVCFFMPVKLFLRGTDAAELHRGPLDRPGALLEQLAADLGRTIPIVLTTSTPPLTAG